MAGVGRSHDSLRLSMLAQLSFALLDFWWTKQRLRFLWLNSIAEVWTEVNELLPGYDEPFKWIRRMSPVLLNTTMLGRSLSGTETAHNKMNTYISQCISNFLSTSTINSIVQGLSWLVTIIQLLLWNTKMITKAWHRAARLHFPLPMTACSYVVYVHIFIILLLCYWYINKKLIVIFTLCKLERNYKHVLYTCHL